MTLENLEATVAKGCAEWDSLDRKRLATALRYGPMVRALKAAVRDKGLRWEAYVADNVDKFHVTARTLATWMDVAERRDVIVAYCKENQKAITDLTLQEAVDALPPKSDKPRGRQVAAARKAEAEPKGPTTPAPPAAPSPTPAPPSPIAKDAAQRKADEAIEKHKEKWVTVIIPEVIVDLPKSVAEALVEGKKLPLLTMEVRDVAGNLLTSGIEVFYEDAKYHKEEPATIVLPQRKQAP